MTRTKSLSRQLLVQLSIALVLSIPVSAQSQVLSPPKINVKLDNQLNRIAAAAISGQTDAVMRHALSRELFRRNNPFRARWNAAGQVQVYLYFDRYGNPPDQSSLTAIGAQDVVVSHELGVVQAWVPAGELYRAASLPAVTRVTVPHYAVTKRTPGPDFVTRTGLVDTVGDDLLGAQNFRDATGYSGQHISVGVISDGDTNASNDFTSGDLPSTVWNDPNNASTFHSSGDEGTAMMEIVYDLAPGVSRLGFCGPQTTVDFVTCLNDFANNINAAVIVDDLGFPGVAMFTDGGFATAVKNFAVAHPAIQLVSAAGNDANDFWSGTWVPMSVSVGPINGQTYTQAENFGTASAPDPKLQFNVRAGDTVSWALEWDDPWVDSDKVTPSTPNIANDYDIMLFDANGNVIACNQGLNINDTNGTCTWTAADQPFNTPGPQPIQGSQYQNKGTTSQTVYLEIFQVQDSSAANRHFKLVVNAASSSDIGLSVSVPSGSIFGQSAVVFPYEISVGAVQPAGNYPVEKYSSRGPVTIEDLTNQTIIETRTPKPDIVGPDCVDVTGTGGFSSPFCGTSAAAPHIAGLIALLESAYQGSSKTPFELFQDGAIKLTDTTGLYPNDTYGYGLPNLINTLNKDPVPLATAFTAPSGVIAGTSTTFNAGCLANGLTSGISYKWTFGSSASPATSTQQNPSVKFASAGSYSVTLQCTNSSGTTNSVTHSVSVSAAPKTGTGSSGGGGGGNFGIFALGTLLLARIRLSRKAQSR